MRFGEWVMMLTAMIIILTLLGIDTGLASIMDVLGITSTGADIAGSQFYTKLILTLSVVGGGAVIVGLFAKSYDPSLVILPFVTFVLGLFIKTFVSIITMVSSQGQVWMTSLVVVIFGTLALGFVMSGVDYFAGR